MTTRWKAAVCISLVLACVAVGVGVAALLATDVEVAQSGEGETLSIDLNEMVLAYHDQLRGIGPQQVTVRQVIQDALWWQVNDPSADENTRMECFAMIGLFHEGRGAEITQEEYVILMDAIGIVWGPAVIEILEENFGGVQ